MSGIAGLSSKALYAKARACYAPRLDETVYTALAAQDDINEFAAYLKNKTPYGAAFEGVGGSGRFTRLQLEAVIKRMTFLRMEKVLRYARLCDNYVSDYFRTKHECECIIRRLRQKGDYTLDSYFLYLPDGFFKNTRFDLTALERAGEPDSLLPVLQGTPYERLVKRLVSGMPSDGYAGRLVPENTLYAYLYETGAAGFKRKLGAREYSEVEGLLAALGDMLTVGTLYRIKKYYAAHEETLRLHVYRSTVTRLSETQCDRLMHAPDAAAFSEALTGTCYKGLVPLLAGEKAAVFTRQYIYNVCRRLFFKSDNAATVALCYGVCTAAEADNLITLTEGISAGAPPEQMLSLLIR